MKRKDIKMPRARITVTEEQLSIFRAKNEVDLVLDSRSHNYPIGMVLRLSETDFGIVDKKTKVTLIGKHARFSLAFEYHVLKEVDL